MDDLISRCVTNHESNRDYLRDLGLATELFSYSIIDKLVSRLSLNPWWQTFTNPIGVHESFREKITEARLRPGLLCDSIRSAIDLAEAQLYFHAMGSFAIAMSRNFLKFGSMPNFKYREHQYKTRLSPAFAILTDSPSLAESASHRYGIDRDRLLSMPFAPAPFLDTELAKDKSSVLRKYGLDEDYFFYPAQFWRTRTISEF